MLPAWCTSVHWCQVSEFTWTGRWAGLACKVNRFFITIFLDPTEEDVCNELGTQLYRVYREQFVWFRSFVNLQINLIFILNPALYSYPASIWRELWSEMKRLDIKNKWSGLWVSYTEDLHFRLYKKKYFLISLCCKGIRNRKLEIWQRFNLFLDLFLKIMRPDISLLMSLWELLV